MAAAALTTLLGVALPLRALPPAVRDELPLEARPFAATKRSELVKLLGRYGLEHPSELAALAFSADSRQLYALAKDGLLLRWDLVRSALVFSAEALSPYPEITRANLALSADGARALIGSEGQPPALLRLAEGRKEITGLERSCTVGEACPWTGFVAFLHGGKRAVALQDRQIAAWEPGAKKPPLEIASRLPSGDWLSAGAASHRRDALALGSQKGTLSVWSASNGAKPRAFPAHRGALSALAFSSDDERLLSAGEDGWVRVWSPSSGKRLAEVPVAAPARAGADEEKLQAIAFSADGKWALVSTGQDVLTGGRVRFWDLGRAKPAWELKGGLVSAVALSPDGRKAALATHAYGDPELREAGRVALVDLRTGKPLLPPEGHVKRVIDIELSPDGRHALSAGTDGSLRRWDLASGKQLAAWSGPAGIAAFALLGAEKLVWQGSDGSAGLWDLGRGKGSKTWRGPTEKPRGSEGGSATAAWLSVSTSQSQYTYIPSPWPTRDRPEVASHALTVPSGSTSALLPVSDEKCDTPTDTLFGLCLRVYSLGRIEASTGKQLRRLSLGERVPVHPPIAVSLPGQGLVAAAFDEHDPWSADSRATVRLEVRDLEGKRVAAMEEKGAVVARALAASAEGDRLLLATDSGSEGSPSSSLAAESARITLWDWRAGKPSKVLQGHKAPISALAFSPKGELALSASLDGTVRLWDLASGAEVDQIDLWSSADDVPYSLAFEPDGQCFLVGTDRGVLLRFRLRSDLP